MTEVLLELEKPETIEVLRGLEAELHFKILKTNEAKSAIDDILVPGDKSIIPEDLSDIFSDKNLDAKELRRKAWQRGTSH